jgi:hypothetical protein
MASMNIPDRSYSGYSTLLTLATVRKMPGRKLLCQHCLSQPHLNGQPDCPQAPKKACKSGSARGLIHLSAVAMK